jgi:hypothetical protein
MIRFCKDEGIAIIWSGLAAGRLCGDWKETTHCFELDEI